MEDSNPNSNPADSSSLDGSSPHGSPADSNPLDTYSQIVSGVAERLTPKVASLRVPRGGQGGGYGRGESLGSGVVFTVDGYEETWRRVETPDGRVHLAIPELLAELAALRVPVAPSEPPAKPGRGPAKYFRFALRRAIPAWQAVLMGILGAGCWLAVWWFVMGRWGRFGLLIIGSLVLAPVVAGVWLEGSSGPPAGLQTEWSGWPSAWFLGAYAAGAVALLLLVGTALVKRLWRLVRRAAPTPQSA